MILRNRPRISALALATILAVTVTAVKAESLGSAASSASSAGSASIGSLSDSVQGSSNSSSRGDKVADGDYRVTEIAVLEGERWQLTLQPLADAAAAPLILRVPRQALAPFTVAVGDPVRVRNQAYGLEFARTTGAGQVEPFFLALNDAALRGLRSQPL